MRARVYLVLLTTVMFCFNLDGGRSEFDYSCFVSQSPHYYSGEYIFRGVGIRVHVVSIFIAVFFNTFYVFGLILG